MGDCRDGRSEIIEISAAPSMIHLMKIQGLVIASLAFISAGAQAENWPSWRATADGAGATVEATPVEEFSRTTNLRWKAKLPGVGNSTPVVWGDKVILTCGIDGRDSVVAYNPKGKESWRATYGKETPGRGQRVGTGANSSPLTDGKHVFVYFKSGTVAGLTLEGRKMWDLNLTTKFGKDRLWWDQGTSPVFAGGNLVVAVMQTEGNSYLVSLDKKTGKEVWRTERKFDVSPESGDSYTTPLVLDLDGTETIVTWGADHLTGHDAGTGRQLWVCGGFNPKKEKFWRVIASPVIAKGVVLVPYGRGELVAGIRPGGKGDITGDAFLWKRDGIGTDASSPSAHDGKFYVLTDKGKRRGTVTCLDAATGETLWKSVLPKGTGQYYASPVLAGDKLYCAREDGTVFCGKVGSDGLAAIKTNPLGETLIASPVAVGSTLFIRGRDHLFCIGK